MKSLSDIERLPIEFLEELAAKAPEDAEKGEGHSKGKPEKSQSRGSKASDLGPLDVPKYLNAHGVPFNEKERGDDDMLYRFEKCYNNPNHGKNESYIRQSSDGKLTGHCSHKSCKDVVTWAFIKNAISGDEDLKKFHKNYDPNWKPSNKKKSKSTPLKDKPFILLNEDSRPKFNPAKMANYLEDKFKPFICEGKDFGEQCYQYQKAGIWTFFPEAAARKITRDALGDYAKPNWIDNAISLLKDQVFKWPDELEIDPMWINLKNGMLHLKTRELVPHSPKFNSRAQLPVSYDPKNKATSSLWVETLAGIFEDDPAKANVIQQFFAYCLFPKIIFPCALFQIGGGANGKGTVESVLYSMLGNDNVSHISLARMSKDFGPVEIKDKLLNSCGETETKPIDVTNFKKLASGDRVQAEVKYKPDVKFTPFAKHMISMNAFPGIRDKTDAFFRRIIVIEYNQKFEGKGDVKGLAEKIVDEELDGVFAWAFDELKNVLKNKEIKVPETVVEAKKRFRHKVNPMLTFVEEDCCLGEEFYVLPDKLYKAYLDWCEDAKKKSTLGKQGFYEQIYGNFKVSKKRKGKKEYYEGIGLLEDPKPRID